jgi:cbb3-type cytochrome oxidase maturation protein
MSVALLLIPLALVLLGGAVYAFFWAVDNDQFEDLDTVARHATDDEPLPPAPPAAPGVEAAPVAPLPSGSPNP